MPAVQYDYDGYDYIVKKRNTATRSGSTTARKTSGASSRGYAPNSSARRSVNNTVSNRTTSARDASARTISPRTTASKSNAMRTTKTTKTSNVRTTSTHAKTAGKNARIEAVKNANKASVRAIMAENGASSTKRKSTTTRRKSANKNLDVPDMLKTKSAKQKSAKPKEMSLKHAEKMVAPNKKAKSVAKKKESVLKTMALSMFAFSMLFLICYRSSSINESFNALGKIKSDLEDTNTVNAQLVSDIETQTDISAIETYAKYQLGMQKPKESQIKKIVINKEDKISTPVVFEMEEESTISKLWHDILNVLD